MYNETVAAMIGVVGDAIKKQPFGREPRISQQLNDVNTPALNANTTEEGVDAVLHLYGKAEELFNASWAKENIGDLRDQALTEAAEELVSGVEVEESEDVEEDVDEVDDAEPTETTEAVDGE